MKFHWMKIISLHAIAMVRGLKYEISFFDERERERGGAKLGIPTHLVSQSPGSRGVAI